jgi:hypothetical protein
MSRAFGATVFILNVLSFANSLHRLQRVCGGLTTFRRADRLMGVCE